MRVLTWNINGLRAVLRRKYGTVKALLDELNADIICFQETKLTKSDFERELALVEGWDSFFSINRGRSAYSGTATFCRKGVADARAAQEGVTGILHSKGESSGSDDLYKTGFSNGAATIWQSYSREEAESIDAEGRCVVTDNHVFVLFNLYGPAISSEENAADRFAYKLQFYKALGVRINALRKRGRRVVVLGDLNIAPAPIDSCEPAPDFLVREDRVWLRQLMTLEGGPFRDVFRLHHSHRTEAYTCWSQASGARVNNWGTRIDLILAADGLGTESNAGDGMRVDEMFVDSDIWPELSGSDHCPSWTDLQLKGELPRLLTLPAFSTRNTFTGKQNKLTAWLRASSSGPAIDSSLAAQSSSSLPPEASQACFEPPAKETQTNIVKKGGLLVAKKAGLSGQTSLNGFVKRARANSVPQGRGVADKPSQCQTPDVDLARALAASLAHRSGQPCQPSVEGESSSAARDPHQSHEEQQQEMGDGNGRKGRTISTAALSQPDTSLHKAPKRMRTKPPDIDTLIEDSCREAADQEEALRQEEEAASAVGKFPGKNSGVSPASAASAWKQIQQRMKPPKCKGHNEDCVIRQVKKKGANFGRLFYVCRRPDGAPPQGRCDFFVWSGSREVRGSAKQK